MIPASFNRVTVDLAALRHNYNFLRQKASGKAFLAMVKADGYGHDMVACSGYLQKCGCTIFGVAELREAVLLRENGINGQIFSMIGFAGENTDLLFDHNITPVIYDGDSLRALSDSGVRLNEEIDVHVKVDTGMSRLGVDPEELDKLLTLFETLPMVRLAGVASHFPSSDDRESESTGHCLEKFKIFQDRVKGKTKLIHHIANSGGTIYFPESRQDMVRCGISLYGYYPDGREKDQENELRPVMSFSSRVLQVKNVEKGTGVSYGGTFITRRKTRLAVLPVGYEDGFSRSLSNCGEVLIRGRRAPVRGRVCMNLCMVDVTDIEGVAAGDEVVILGSQGRDRITADEIGAKSGTISYEVLCKIGNSNEREFI